MIRSHDANLTLDGIFGKDRSLSGWLDESLFWINVTAHPTAEWNAQQITEAFPWHETPRYLIRDRDGIYVAVIWRVTPLRRTIRSTTVAPRGKQYSYVPALM